jgi:hypothetical protein
MGEMRGYKKRGIPRPFDCYTYYIYLYVSGNTERKKNKLKDVEIRKAQK